MVVFHRVLLLHNDCFHMQLTKEVSPYQPSTGAEPVAPSRPDMSPAMSAPVLCGFCRAVLLSGCPSHVRTSVISNEASSQTMQAQPTEKLFPPFMKASGVFLCYRPTPTPILTNGLHSS